jgi:hypothetical protein
MKTLFPPIFYAAMFFGLSPHLPSRFFTHLFADAGDGFQTYWDMWWVKKAIVDLHQSPYFTSYLYYPRGTTLVAQTLHPFNGLVSLLLPFLSVGEAYNVMVVFGFAIGGWTAFLLCRELTGYYWPSLVGGAVFTFSSYHFAHAQGHMQLVSLEWIPLFVLLWRRFVRSNDRWTGVKTGLASALVLFLVLLCDFYYFFYCVVAGALFYLWVARERRDLFYLLRKENLQATAAFVLPTLFTSGVLSGALILQNRKDPFLGSHESRQYAMDVLAPFVPGGHWLFGHWTHVIWGAWPGNLNENSVYLGLGVVFLFSYVWKHRSVVRVEDLRFWYLLAAVFGIMSLGPTLFVAGREVRLGPVFHIMGKEVSLPLLPYAFAWVLFPPLRLSGVPVRMMVMVQLVAAIVTAGGIQLIIERSAYRGRYWVTALLALILFEYLPAPIPATPLAPPKYVEVLRDYPEAGAVYDNFTFPTRALANQTFHQRPISFGYISRMPTSVASNRAEILRVADAGDYQQLCQKYGFRFLVGSPVPGSLPAEDRLTLIYSEPDARIFNLCGSG